MSFTSAGSSSFCKALKLFFENSAAFSVVNVSFIGCWKPYEYSLLIAFPVVLAKLFPKRFSDATYGM
tara:strand:- start:433 stop:633 length:201 start_codon:yes stop_codon:yes gene_type:complete